MATETGQTPIQWDLTGEDAITQGADWSRYMALYYIHPTTGVETLWNTTGFTGRMTVRASYDAPVSLTATTANGRLVTGLQGPNNAFCLSIQLSNSYTASLVDWGLGVWDLELVDTSGTVTRVYAGRAALSREVST
jgi:hypothetical protein